MGSGRRSQTVHVVSLDVANGMDSALVTMDAQVAAIAAAVAADKRLAGGFDAVGLRARC